MNKSQPIVSRNIIISELWNYGRMLWNVQDK